MSISIEKAMQLVQAAHAEAESIDLAITAVVVDESGRLVALGRMDGARPITVDIAMNKAYTAASFKQPTQELSGVAGQAWFQSLIVSSGGKVTAGGGAIPLEDGGAIAVAGGTDDQDHKCCEAALRRQG
jgi:cob(I)alamin adenosyltransferase